MEGSDNGMKIIVNDRIQVGDWILFNPQGLKELKGKIFFTKVKKIKYEFEDYFKIDFDSNKIENTEWGTSEISKKSYFAVLNEREVKNLIKLKDKIKVIQGLKE